MKRKSFSLFWQNLRYFQDICNVQLCCVPMLCCWQHHRNCDRQPSVDITQLLFPIIDIFLLFSIMYIFLLFRLFISFVSNYVFIFFQLCISFVYNYVFILSLCVQQGLHAALDNHMFILFTFMYFFCLKLCIYLFKIMYFYLSGHHLGFVSYYGCLI